ncbi:MAG: hypothetical protein WCK47_03320 [bacterium]
MKRLIFCLLVVLARISCAQTESAPVNTFALEVKSDLRESRELQRQGKYVEAKGIVQRVLNRDASNPEARSLMSGLTALIGQQPAVSTDSMGLSQQEKLWLSIGIGIAIIVISALIIIFRMVTRPRRQADAETTPSEADESEEDVIYDWSDYGADEEYVEETREGGATAPADTAPAAVSAKPDTTGREKEEAHEVIPPREPAPSGLAASSKLFSGGLMMPGAALFSGEKQSDKETGTIPSSASETPKPRKDDSPVISVLVLAAGAAPTADKSESAEKQSLATPQSPPAKESPKGISLINISAIAPAPKTAKDAPSPKPHESSAPSISLPLTSAESAPTPQPAVSQSAQPAAEGGISKIDLSAMSEPAANKSAPASEPAETKFQEPAPEPMPQLDISSLMTPTDPRYDSDLPQMPAGDFSIVGLPPIDSLPDHDTMPALDIFDISEPPTLSSGDVICELTFDDTPQGTQPTGWQGSFPYAILQAAETQTSSGASTCLKYDKTAAAGNASYVYKFPKTSGKITMEFDIRCDRKNDKLLGFYIERDADAKTSAHVLFHQIGPDSPAALHIQGESVPYELGTWRHIKYVLNLPTGMLSAFVDGREVARDVKLPVNLTYVDTLAIRDNPGTTGALWLANIRISHA